MHQKFLTKAALLVALASSALACSHAQAVCEMICECEHCNDQEETITCDQYDTAQDVADAYSCSDKYDAYLTCIEDKGKCDETISDYSTRGSGTCSGTQPLGMSCMTANDCNGGGGGNVECTAGMCMLTVCAGSGQPCQNNGDCNGQDLCDSEQNDYFTCINDASSHGGVAGGL